ncbi:MAG TPA: translesion DNA synthesis-associated protein ImuA [Woeseiaceae bacterium]|nr:translesion DNA synthesis-associated protein ImuA [Woeseiaceae bacterium]
MLNPADVSDALESLLQNPRVWRGIRHADRHEGHPATHPTGYARLDRHLPGGGWPRHALTEILLEHYGTGELELLMPALARLCNADDSGLQDSDDREAREAGWIAWIAPPFQPYPPALLQWGINLQHVLIVHPGESLEALWAAEQALSCGNCAAVLLWSDVLDNKTSRRLQLAAEKGRSWAIAFRPLKALTQSSAAALRIELSAGEQGTDVRILKSRGGRPVNVSGVIRNDTD